MRERSKATIVTVVLAVSVLLNYIHEILAKSKNYVNLYKSHAWYWVESLDKCALVMICCLAIWLLYRGGLREILGELRVNRIPWKGVGTMLLCTTPMLVGFVVTRRLGAELSLAAVAFKGLVSPFAEELHARSFAFLQLYRRARWPFFFAALPQALLSGFGHIEQGETIRDEIGIFILIFSGSLIFAWCLLEWNSIWVPFVLHTSMNIWWDLFAVSRNILGGWFPFALQQITMLLVLWATYRKRQQRLELIRLAA